jgi:hypothetical protein
MNLRPALTLTLALLTAGSIPSARADEGLPLPTPAPERRALVDLGAEVEAAIALVSDRARFRADNAAAVMRQAYEDLAGLAPERVDHAAIARDPERLQRRLFDLILALDDRMAELHRAGQLTDELAAGKRRALRAARYLREQVLLVARGANRLPAEPGIDHDFSRPTWIARPGYEGRRLESFPRTFVVLCVGTTVVSAAIARSGAEECMFSHLAVAHRAEGPQTIEGKSYPANTWFIIEALIEKGVTIHPLADHYEGTTRDVIFFVRDEQKQPAVDAAAAAFFARARDAINARKPLGYDFTMGNAPNGLEDVVAGTTTDGPVDPSAYFCSGVGEEIFRKAGVDLLPNRTLLRQGPSTRALFESWGIDPDARVPAPSDADVSATLLRVAEGCFLDGLTKSHVSHVVLAEMFRWMDEEEWQLRAPWWARGAVDVVGAFNGGVFDLGLVPDTMAPDTMRTFMPLAKAGDPLVARLTAENDAFRARTGRDMTPAELRKRLLEVRGDVDIGDWFGPVPPALGRYVLETTTTLFGRKRVDVTVTRGAGLDFAVTRQVAGGPVGRGVARHRGDRLMVEFGGGYEPARIVYTIDAAGKISGGTAQNARIEKGARVP